MSYSTKRRAQRSTIGLPINDFLESLDTKYGSEMTLDDVFDDSRDFRDQYQMGFTKNSTPIKEPTPAKMYKENLYDTLGLTPSCTAKDLKAAYRNLIMRMHPDKGGDGGVFNKIQLAYKVLSDEESRMLYDEFGESAIDIIQSFSQRLY
ncbi:unnamed protein product [Blepharisma stoltei]|uniref:J domain-containing protein n=1 Tax=Blepharisma stoltei TaxID=1481888 RepID=A0AAU9JV80_9CILI|nr:unnamed protein product [Blepharisma stoltei]